MAAKHKHIDWRIQPICSLILFVQKSMVLFIACVNIAYCRRKCWWIAGLFMLNVHDTNFHLRQLVNDRLLVCDSDKMECLGSQSQNEDAWAIHTLHWICYVDARLNRLSAVWEGYVTVYGAGSFSVTTLENMQWNMYIYISNIWFPKLNTWTIASYSTWLQSNVLAQSDCICSRVSKNKTVAIW